jgi:hypothetical protein
MVDPNLGGDFGPYSGPGGSSGGPGGPYGPLPDLPGVRRPRFRRRHKLGCLGFLVVVAVALFVVFVGLNPWALHMGNRLTLTETWQGYGTVQASNGGRYVLYLNLTGGYENAGSGDHLSCSGVGGGCDSLKGDARLCTKSGHTYTFELTGAVHAWWSTDGAATKVDLTNSPPLPDGWVVAFHGKWEGPDLALSSPDNSFTEVFTPAGVIRSATSTADAGTATTVIKYGGSDGFIAACHALAT